MKVQSQEIELLPPVIRGTLVAIIHISVCLVAAQRAAATPENHYFSYLFIDLLQNESFLLGCFVALTSYSFVLRGVVGIIGLGLLVQLCNSSRVTERASALPLVMVLLTLAGGCFGICIRLLSTTLGHASNQSSVDRNVQFTLQQLMIITALSCCLLAVLRITFLAVGHEGPPIVVLASVVIAIPTTLLTSLAAINLSRTLPLNALMIGNLFLAIVGGLVMKTAIVMDVDEILLWLAETMLHLIAASLLFRWMGLRIVTQPYLPLTERAGLDEK